MLDKVLAALNSARGRRIRVVAAFWAIPSSLALWVASALTWASGEPQFVLGLSWLAITLTAVDILTTSQVHEESGDGDQPSSGDTDAN